MDNRGKWLPFIISAVLVLVLVFVVASVAFVGYVGPWLIHRAFTTNVPAQ
jgi:hypothetical protein